MYILKIFLIQLDTGEVFLPSQVGSYSVLRNLNLEFQFPFSRRLSTLGPHYWPAATWSRPVLTRLDRCVNSGSPQSHHALECQTRLLHSSLWFSCPQKHFIWCPQVYTMYFSAGEGEKIIGRCHNVRKGFLSVPLLREF